MTTNPGMENKSFVNIGFYLLFALPMLLFFPAKKWKWHPWLQLILLIFFLSIGNYLTWEQPSMSDFKTNNRLLAEHPEWAQGVLQVFPQKLNEFFYTLGSFLDQLPLLGRRSWRILNVFLAIGLLLLMRKMAGGYLRSFNQKEKHLLLLTTAYLFMWYITGSGIPWYGFTGLVLLFILIQLMFQKGTIVLRQVHFFGLAIGFIVLFLLRFSGASIGQKEASSPEIVLNSPLLYSSGVYKDMVNIVKNTNPIYHDAARFLNAAPESKIYMAGTLFIYFIENNHQRVHQDNQLEEFIAIQNSQEDSPDYFLSVLIENGFDYVVFNPADINYDKTPEQTFRKKYDRFVQILLNSDQAQLIMTDNKVLNPEGQLVSGLEGSTRKRGQLALFRLNEN
jgi:hypothetical protein